jgi:hypothetical protein
MSDDHTRPKVIVYYGGASTGKTTRAVKNANDLGIGVYFPQLPMLDENFASFGPKYNWLHFLEEYRGEGVLILDDFLGAETFPFSHFLRVLDGHATLEAGWGRVVKCAWKYIYITSSQAPTEWYGDSPVKYSHIYSRINEDVSFGQQPSTQPA